jgi:hypothetical protein
MRFSIGLAPDLSFAPDAPLAQIVEHVIPHFDGRAP